MMPKFVQFKQRTLCADRVDKWKKFLLIKIMQFQVFKKEYWNPLAPAFTSCLPCNWTHEFSTDSLAPVVTVWLQNILLVYLGTQKMSVRIFKLNSLFCQLTFIKYRWRLQLAQRAVQPVLKGKGKNVFNEGVGFPRKSYKEEGFG